MTFRTTLCILLLLLTACAAESTPPTAYPTLAPEQLIKRLATVELPPTLDPAARQATQGATRPTLTANPTATGTPTPYIGVFLGDSGGEGLPVVDSDQFAGTLVAAAPLVFPTVAGSACIIAPDPLYGSAWANSVGILEALGCPGEPITSYIGAIVFFERGAMYALPTGEIYTMVPGGSAAGRYWYAPLPPPEQSWVIEAPPGLLAPTGVFGATWRAIDGIRQAVGFAQAGEQPISLSLQRFERGALLLDGSAGQTFVFVGVTGVQYGDGVLYGPFEAAN